jgi:hypothetical protein
MSILSLISRTDQLLAKSSVVISELENEGDITKDTRNPQEEIIKTNEAIAQHSETPSRK